MCAHICKENIEKGREKMHFGGGVWGAGMWEGAVQQNEKKFYRRGNWMSGI